MNEVKDTPIGYGAGYGRIAPVGKWCNGLDVLYCIRSLHARLRNMLNSLLRRLATALATVDSHFSARNNDNECQLPPFSFAIRARADSFRAMSKPYTSSRTGAVRSLGSARDVPYPGSVTRM
jgi:hypothetical protein